MVKIVMRSIFSFVLICIWCLYVSLNRIPKHLEQSCKACTRQQKGNYQILVDGRDVFIEGTAPSEMIIAYIQREALHIRGLRRLSLNISVHPDTLQMQRLRNLTRKVVLFDKNSDLISPETNPLLDTLSVYLLQCPRLHLKLSGFTDASGDSLHNQTLSEKRAQTVKDALISKGIRGERISALGYGVHSPDSSMLVNDTARRVEFTFWEKHP